MKTSLRRTRDVDAGVLIARLGRLLLAAALLAASPSDAQETTEPSEPTSLQTGEGGDDALADATAERHDRSAAKPTRRYALIVVGLPGDEIHRERFQKTTETWIEWLTTVAGIHRNDITLLSTTDPEKAATTPTAENIATAARQLGASLTSEDSVWVFLLGHGSQDQRHAWFHLPGPDLDSTQWAGLFAQFRATEQVVWLTHAASGSFLKPMSLPGRIVITATDANGEVNETRFPHTLADVMQDQLDLQEKPPEQASPSNVLGLFLATVTRVNQAFESENLVPTEHAQLDDNGDGEGSEASDLSTETLEEIDYTQPLVDGQRAGQTNIALPSSLDEEAIISTADEPKRNLLDNESE